jgi:hypothetical protein
MAYRRMAWSDWVSSPGSDSFCSRASVTALFPVASVPWMTMLRHGAAVGYYQSVQEAVIARCRQTYVY